MVAGKELRQLRRDRLTFGLILNLILVLFTAIAIVRERDAGIRRGHQESICSTAYTTHTVAEQATGYVDGQRAVGVEATVAHAATRLHARHGDPEEGVLPSL